MPTPTPRPQIPIINIREISWAANPVAYIPATLIIKGNAAALPQGSESFKVNVLIDTGFLSRPLNYWFDTGDAESAKYVTPGHIGNGNFEIRVSRLEMPRIVRGRVAVTVISNADPSIQGSSGEKPLDVASSPEGYRACYEPLYVILMGIYDHLPLDLPQKIKQYGDLAKSGVEVTKITLEVGEHLDRCNGDASCGLEVLRQWAIDLNEHNLDELVGTFPPGRIAATLRDAILATPQLINCGVWYWEELVALFKLLTSRGEASNLFATGSPVYPLVTDRAGRRAGFLPNGQVVEEIPNSVALEIGDRRFVLFPGADAVDAQVVAYANGTMDVATVFATGNATAATYNNVSVVAGMRATLDSSDPAAVLIIDNNADGQVDYTRAPDAKEQLRGAATMPGDTSRTFAETGHTVSGRFWEVWQGGRSFDDSLYINGFPITDMHDEASLTDGRVYKTQWFERARFEEHPDNQPPHDVLLGLLGVQAIKGRETEEAFRPVADQPDGIRWFAETGHTLGDNSEGGRAIARFWNDLGGLPQFGYPLSQPFMERNMDDGNSYLVQYFERQRFEFHPENQGTRYEVLLGRLGAEQYGQSDWTPVAIQEQTLTRMINNYRQSKGLPAFNSDPLVLGAARRGASWYGTTDPSCAEDVGALLAQYLSEIGYTLRAGVYQWACMKENSPASIMSDFNNDAAFRETWERPDLEDIGCGWWPQTPRPESESVWVICLFASR